MKTIFTRAITGVVFTSAVVYSIFHPGLYFLTFLFFESIIISEAARMLKIKGLELVLLFFCMFSLTMLGFSTTFFLNLLMITTLISQLLLIIFLYKKQIPHILNSITTFLSILGGCLAILLLIFDDQAQYHPWQMISIFVLIWTSDTFAYLFGMAFGKHKLFKTISPKKTVEGLVGGTLASLLMALFISEYLGFSKILWASIGLIVPIHGTLGDLSVSRLKRLLGLKDTGSILPGHGGLYDRFDSIIFVAPVILCIFLYGFTDTLSTWSMKVTPAFVYLLDYL